MLLTLEDKSNENDNIIRNKTRLIAQSYIQEENVDYVETFAQIARS